MRRACICLLSLGLLCGVARADVETGLVAYYPLEEGEGAVAANAVQGTIAGDANLIGTGYEWVAGKVGDFAILFKAVAGTAADCGTWNPSETTGQLTVAVWIKWEGTSGGYQGVVSKRDSWDPPLTYWNIEIDQATSDLGFFRYDSYPDFGTNIPPIAEWQHVAVTYDGTTTTMYLDGAFIANSTAFSFGPTADAHIVFGAIEAAGWNPFNGTIDEVRIYDRALSEDDVIELYNWTGLVSAGPDQRVTTGDRVTLQGTGPADAAFTWEQIGGRDDFVATLEPSPNQATVEFNTPARDIGFLLTFRLTVASPTKGTAADEASVYVLAPNPPKLPPSNFRVSPLDLGGLGLGFRLEWDSIVDAASYQIALKLGGEYFWTYTTTNNFFEFTGMMEGVARTVAVRGENKYSKPASANPADHGVPSEDVTYTAMPNLARKAADGGTRPPLDPVEGVTYVVSEYSIAGMNGGQYTDNNDSRNGMYKSLDFWGYVWSQPYFFDHIVYYTGRVFADGGWFTSLKVQYTRDGGATWMDAPIVDIFPDYDFSDQRGTREHFTRYDIVIPTLWGNGIRIAGTPGGAAYFTSVAELEIFGDQMQGPLVVQGIDAAYPEGGTATLDGSLTFSTAGPITSYKWEFVSGPSTPTIHNSTSAVATFEASNVASDQVFVFKLTAGDGTNSGSDNDVRITVKNLVTTSVAGPDQKVYEGTTATLDGSGSMTTTGSISYLWTQKSGTDVGVTGKTTATVQFTAPIIWGYTEDLVFELKVDDGASGISTDEVTVQVRNKIAAPIYPLGAGYMKDLLHLGTNPTDRILSPLGIDTDQLAAFGGQAMVNPAEGDAYDFTGTGVTVTRNPMVWTPQHDNGGFFGDEGLDNFVQMYHIYIISPEQRDARAIFRHDDEMRCWNNGALAFMRDSWDGNPGDVAIERSADFTLFKGVNSMTLKFHEGDGGNYLAVRFTDLSDVEYADLYYAFGPSLVLADAYAARTLPVSYQPLGTTDVSLSFKVNPNNKPSSVTVREKIPTGLTEADVVAPGAVVAGGNITWTLTGAQLKPSAINYSLKIPAGAAQSLDFAGTVSFATTSTDIFGDSTVYAVPTEPRYLEVEMLAAAHITWAPPVAEGVASYRIQKSVDGGVWQDIGTTTGTSFVDSATVAGKNYSYRIAASNVRAIEGPFSAPTDQASLPTMLIREAEDFNYGGGLYPGSQNCPAANEAPTASDLDAQYDFFHPNKGGDATTRVYRPNDNVGIHFGTDVVTRIGWVSPGSWWRYTFNVPEPGWIKLTFRIATHPSRQQATLAAYWDEQLIGSVTFANNFVLTWEVLEDQIQTTAGPHTLRLQAVGAGTSDVFDFNTIAIGFNWAAPKRKAIWADNFDSYTTTAEVKATGGWNIVDKSNPKDPEAAWQLWDTEDDLGTNPGNLEGMNDKYMVSDSDLAPASQLDEELISPEVDCTNYVRIRLNFNKNFRVYPDDPEDDPQVGEVDIRVYDAVTGWGGWVNLLHLDKSMIDPALDPADDASPEQLDLSPYDGKKIQLRWRFFDVFFDYWFAIDEVKVSGLAPPAIKDKVTGISLVAGKVALTWNAFGPGQYTVQYTDNLVGGAWTNVAGMPINVTNWPGETISGVSKRYYRVMAPSQ